MPQSEPITNTVLALERAALDRWGKGDPGGYLDISAPDVTYFDPFVERRIDGRNALRDWYEPFRGKIQIEWDEIINPHVNAIGDAALLTFQFHSRGSEREMLWNCTEVYCRSEGEWKIVHSHWSFAKTPHMPA